MTDLLQTLLICTTIVIGLLIVAMCWIVTVQTVESYRQKLGEYTAKLVHERAMEADRQAVEWKNRWIDGFARFQAAEPAARDDLPVPSVEQSNIIILRGQPATQGDDTGGAA